MIYRETITNISSKIIDNKAKGYSEIQTDAQTFSKPEFLVMDNIRTTNYMTNELNYSVLNGELQEISYPASENDFVYVSENISKSDNTFNSGEEPTIQIELWDRSNEQNPVKKTATSLGITLNFDGYYLPDNINIKYYDLNNNEIADNTFRVSSVDFFCNHGSLIANYHKIIITFNTTKYPYSFIKLNNIDYGAVYNWSSDDIESSSSILSANIIEETDIISNTLAINTCEFTIYDADEDFNMLDPNDIYNTIHKYQEVQVTEKIRNYENNVLKNEYDIYMGRFYIKEWSSYSEHQLTFKCVDAIGVLEDSKFNICKKYSYDGSVDTVASVIQDIMSCVNIGDSTIQYDVDASILNKPLTGFIPICSCRQALQQVLFCIGAVADCSRSDYIKIYEPDPEIKYNIFDNNNLEYEKIQKNDIVSDVLIYKNILSNGSDKVKIYDGYLNATSGQNFHKIRCEELIRYHDSIDDSMFVEPVEKADINYYPSNLNYFELEVRSPDNFEVFADIYSITSILIKSLHNNNSKVTKTIRCRNNYLIDDIKISNENYNYATDAANRLLNYYSKPNTMDTEFILSAYQSGTQDEYISEQTGYWCFIKNKYGNDTIGNINKMEIDLTGGFISKTKLVCVEDSDAAKYSYFCYDYNDSNRSGDDQSELYSGEINDDNIGLI